MIQQSRQVPGTGYRYDVVVVTMPGINLNIKIDYSYDIHT